MSDTPRERRPDGSRDGRDEPRPGADSTGDSGDEPITGPPFGTAADPAEPASPGVAGRPGRGRAGGFFRWLRVPGRADFGPESDVHQRRRRRWLVAAIATAAALVAAALCAGTVGIVSAVSERRDRISDLRTDHRLRGADCLDLEQRLNRLVPPGAATTPQAKASAIRAENEALGIYLNQIRGSRGQNGWRRLLDARTAYAGALDLQARSRKPAFYVAPRTADGRTVADQLLRRFPAACAGPVRRLSAPDL